MEDDMIVVREDRAVVPAQHQQQHGLSGIQIAGIAVGALLFVAALSQIPDLIRYARMSSM